MIHTSHLLCGMLTRMIVPCPSRTSIEKSLQRSWIRSRMLERPSPAVMPKKFVSEVEF
jgi:hypothetical protein